MIRLFTTKFTTIGFGIAVFSMSWAILILLFKISFIHGLYETLESYIYYCTFSSSAHPSEHLLLIDEEDNVYDREIYAKLILGLDACSANIIALDVLFDGKNNAIENAALIEATIAASNKIIHSIEFLNHDLYPEIPERFHFKTSGSKKSQRRDFIIGAYGAKLPFPDLLKVTKHLGYVTASTDLARRDDHYFPMLINYNDRFYPSLPLLSVMKFLGIPTDSLPDMDDDSILLRTETEIFDIPTDISTQILVNFIDPKKFAGKRISVEEALKRIETKSSCFKNKIVLIGNSCDTQEQTFGPHFKTYPNLIVYASLISQLLNGENISEGITESLCISFILLIMAFVWLFFFSQSYTRLKAWHIGLCSFLLVLFIAYIALNLRIKIYVILPSLVFCVTYILSKGFYEKGLRKSIGSKKQIAYLDYYLLIGPKRKKDNTYPVFLIDSPAGEDFCEMKFPLKADEIKTIREEMSVNMKLDVKVLKEFGSNIFKALFQPAIRDQYDKSLGMIYAKNANLRLKLRIDAPDLACYPWEFLYDGDQAKQFLGLHKNISVTRFLAIPGPVPKVALKPPLKILVIISNPAHQQYPALAVEKEKKLIKKALQKLQRNGIIQLRFLKKATLKGLARELRKEIDVIHFIGHGGYTEALGGCLVFEHERIGHELVNIDRIGKLLEGKPIRLVILNACQTSQTFESDISMGVAQGLVKIGIPAVIAMQFSIPDQTAIDFSKEFYTTLAETFQVDRAVSEARQKIFINLESGRIDWGIPVLFMRKDDGVLFE